MYIGEAKVASHGDMDGVHELCQMLCIVFPAKSLSVVDAKNDMASDIDDSENEVCFIIGLSINCRTVKR